MTSMLERLAAVPAPPPVLTRERAAALTPRQWEILDELGRLFDKGFADVTMAELAGRLNCSLRTLYGIAESRDQLVLAVVDRNLRSIGRTARGAIADQMSALDAVQAYLAAANTAVSDIEEEFAHDMESVPDGIALYEAHSAYIVDVTRCLLDIAVGRGEIADVDTAAVARMVAGLGRDFSRPEVMGSFRSSPSVAADQMVALVVDALRSSAPTTAPREGSP
jgi:AcrR family transcriptional regulator